MSTVFPATELDGCVDQTTTCYSKRGDEPEPVPGVLQYGDVIAKRYVITAFLGEGGMGAVYRARDRAQDRDVAIKVLHAELRHERAIVQRFEREALATSLIGSRHAVRLYDMGRSGELHYLVMECLEGETLEDRLDRLGWIAPADACAIAMQVLAGLVAAHDVSIVHRDIKPESIFLSRAEDGSELVKLLDFGISKFTAIENERLTISGAVLGTPRYMAPELRHSAENADVRSDIYSVGATLYKMLTGRSMHGNTSVPELMARLFCSEPPSVRQLAPHVDGQLAAIVHRALRCDAAQRFQDARSFLHALQERCAEIDATWLWTRAPRRRSRSWLVRPPHALVLVLATLGVGCLLGSRHEVATAARGFPPSPVVVAHAAPPPPAVERVAEPRPPPKRVPPRRNRHAPKVRDVTF